MSLTNPDKVVTEQRLSEFYTQILPYLNRQEALANASYLAKIGENANGNATYNGNLLTLPNNITIDSASVYSTAEKVVGCWTDGRPLYQKSYVMTAPSSGGSTSIVTLSSSWNLLNIFGWQKWVIGSDSGNVGLPYAVHNLQTLSFYTMNGQLYYELEGSDLEQFLNKPMGVTLQYTKNSDAANSFNYAGENDYSTTEKIVGTWIDSKPIYQKTITGTLPSTTDEMRHIPVGASVKDYINITGFLINNANALYMPIPNITADYTGLARTLGHNDNELNPDSRNCVTVSINFATWVGSQVYITVRYTKTTD